MATKADFTPEQWGVLQWAVADTMAYVSIADPGLWDSFKETTSAARYIADARTSSPSPLVRDLAGDLKAGRDKKVSGNPADIAGQVVDRVAEAARLVASKSEEDAEAFRRFILGIADATAEAKDGVAQSELKAVERLRAALE